MRKVILTVVGLAGLVLLCGSGALLAQTDTTTAAGTTVGQDATDTRAQGTTSASTSGVGGSGTQSGTPGTDTVSGTGSTGTTGAEASGTPSGTGTAGTPGTQASGVAAGTEAAPAQGQATGGAGGSMVELPQSVLQLQQEVAQVRQDVAQLRAQLESMNANMGVGGSGQAGEEPSGVQGGTQGTTTATTPPSAPLRAGTAQETGTPTTPASGQAVVDVIYTGTVRSVANGRLELLDDDGKSFTIELGDRTLVLRNGKRISAQELKQGTRVRATVDMLAGHNQAIKVMTLPAQ